MDYAKAAAEAAFSLTKQYGPDAYKTVLQITSLTRLSNIIGGLIVFAALCTGTYVCFNIAKNFAEVSGGESYKSLFLLFFVWGPTIPFWTKFFSFWNWVGVFKPDLYLAKTLIDKVIN